MAKLASLNDRRFASRMSLSARQILVDPPPAIAACHKVSARPAAAERFAQRGLGGPPGRTGWLARAWARKRRAVGPGDTGLVLRRTYANTLRR